MKGSWRSAAEVAKRRKAVLKLRAKGRRMEEIADKLGITRQRVGQIIRDEQKRAEAAK